MSTPLFTIEYEGTSKQWRSIEKEANIFKDAYSGEYPVQILCSDKSFTK